jgi:Ca2+-binding EF-hand superfamily protein
MPSREKYSGNAGIDAAAATYNRSGGGTFPFLEQEMRNRLSMFALAIALAAMVSLATAAPKTGNAHGPGQVPEPGAAAAGAGAADPLFALLDTDGDGVISAKELHKAVAVLKELDANHDGSITWEEVVAGSGVAHQLQMGQSDAGIGTTGGGFSGKQSQAVERFMQYDKNHDGKLTPDELPPQALALLRDADLNKDGAIDARELQIAVEKMGDRMKAGMAGAGINGHMPGGNPIGATTGAKSP